MKSVGNCERYKRWAAVCWGRGVIAKHLHLHVLIVGENFCRVVCNGVECTSVP